MSTQEAFTPTVEGESGEPKRGYYPTDGNTYVANAFRAEAFSPVAATNEVVCREEARVDLFLAILTRNLHQQHGGYVDARPPYTSVGVNGFFDLRSAALNALREHGKEMV